MTRKEKEQCGISKYAPVKSIVKLSEDGKVQAVYNSVKDAAECNGLKPAAICNAIKRQGWRHEVCIQSQIRKQGCYNAKV